MDLESYKKNFSGLNDPAPGWDAIDLRLREVYASQKPKHWGTIIKHMLGGPDPIDGISAYECRDGGIVHQHFITYGYSSLYYDEESFGGEYSRFGFEMTFRLAGQYDQHEKLVWVCSLLQNIAKYVFESGHWFKQYNWLPANGPIRADFDTDIVGLAFLNDPVLKSINSPHGKVDFIQAFGITQAEIDLLGGIDVSAKEIIEFHRKDNPLLITDLARKNKVFPV